MGTPRGAADPCCSAVPDVPTTTGVAMSAPSDAAMLSLVVAARHEIATGIHAFELRSRNAAVALPAFAPGSHIGMRTPAGHLRKFSLTNDPQERDRYVIAVKRESAGRGGSAGLIDTLRTGDVVECAAPRNDFALAERPTQFIFIAGGIGITPIMSMIRHLKASGRARFKLYYLTRDPAATAFREELTSPAFHGQVVIHHDEGDPARAFDLWPVLERPTPAHVYCCGPRPLLEAVRDMTGHWSASAIHFESFVDAAAMHAPEDRPFRVRLAQSGVTLDVTADQSILDALRAAGFDAPSSCEAGTCGTCRTRLLAGDADHRDLVLAPDERDDSIMICVSRARSGELVIDR
jgi:phthalate 4,5-dioxygenase reductase subunit